jgi:Zn-dependent protease with chaperone function
VVSLNLILLIGIAGMLFFGAGPVSWAGIGAIAGRASLFVTLVGVVLGTGWVTYSLTRTEKWIVRRLGAYLVPTGELLETKYALKDMAIASGHEVAPALYMMETGNVNAFVVAHGRRRAVVGVTRGMVERLSVDEQRAVFANLMARLLNGDVLWASGVTAIMRPMWAWRDRDLTRDDTRYLTGASEPRSPWHGQAGDSTAGDTDGVGAGFLWFMVIGFLFILVTEIIMVAGHREADLRHAEKADAEGMLLLKDPRSMLDAIEKCVRFNNWVPTAGPGFSLLFYCWTGDDTDDESDPEWRRVTRLREVLGVEGLAPPVIEPNRHELLAPPAPRMAGQDTDRIQQ